MFERLRLLFQLFRVGHELADPGKWKAGQIQANVVGGIIVTAVGLLGTFGIHLPIDDTTALALAGGIVAVVNVVLTCITSARAGLLPPKPTEQPGQVYTEQPGGVSRLQSGPVADAVQQPGSGPQPGADFEAAAPGGPAPHIYVHLDESSQYIG